MVGKEAQEGMMNMINSKSEEVVLNSIIELCIITV